MNETLNTISARRSVRRYADTPLTAEQRACIVRAALESPSSLNKQPWHFTVVSNRVLLDEFNRDLLAIKKLGLSENYHVFYHAPEVVFIFTPETPMTRFAQVDCGIAVENIALAAQSMGLGSVIVGTPVEVFLAERKPYYHEALQVPEGYEFAVAIALGTPAEAPKQHSIRDGLVTWID